MGAEARHSDIDLDSDNAQPYTREIYQTLRDIGSVVYLPINEMYAITRYLALNVGLRADEILISSRGPMPMKSSTTARYRIALVGTGSLLER
jgi:hypothetical protein